MEQNLDVESQSVGLWLEDCHVHAPGGVDRLRGGGADITLVGGEESAAPVDLRVGGGLQVELDLLAAGCGLEQHRVLVLRVDGLQRSTVRAVDEGLALEAGAAGVEAEVQDGLHLPPRPLSGYAAVESEPCGAPGRAPRGADAVRFEIQIQALCGWDGLAGQLVSADVEGLRSGMHGWPDPFGEGAVCAVESERDVIVHEGPPG